MKWTTAGGGGGWVKVKGVSLLEKRGTCAIQSESVSASQRLVRGRFLMDGQGMQRVQDREFGARVGIIEHSPTMDLIAVSSSDKSVAVYRSVSPDFQRLFSINRALGSPVSTVTWRPCGKMLALGHEDGSTSLYSVETGALVDMPLPTIPRGSTVNVSRWGKSIESVQKMEPMGFISKDQKNSTPLYSSTELRGILPSPPPLSQQKRFGEAAEANVRSDFMRTVEDAAMKKGALDILAIGDARGVITLNAYGFFPVGCADLSAAFEIAMPGAGSNMTLSCASVADLSVSPHLQTITAVLQSRILDTGEGAGDERYRYHLVFVDSSALYERRDEISFLGAQCGAIGDLVVHLDEAVEKIKALWAQGLNLLQKRLEELHNLLGRYGSNSNVLMEFFTLLTAGVATPALQQFFANTLTEVVAGRMQKAFEGSCAEIESICRTHIIRVAEKLLYFVGEIQAASRWPNKFDVLGITEDTVSPLLEVSTQLVLCGEEFLSEVREARTNLTIFFAWLQQAIPHARGDDPSTRPLGVAEYDLLAKLLSAPLEGVDRGNRASNFGINRLCHQSIAEHFNEYGDEVIQSGALPGAASAWFNSSTAAVSDSTPRPGLRFVLDTMKYQWNDMFRRPAESINQSFQPITNIPIFSSVVGSGEGVLSKPRCSFAMHIGTMERVKETGNPALPSMYQYVAFSGVSANHDGSTDDHGRSVWIVRYNTAVDASLANSRLHSGKKRGRRQILMGEEEGPVWDWGVVCMDFGEGSSIVDLEFYGEAPLPSSKDEAKLFVLLQKEAQEEGDVLASINFHELEFMPVRIPPFTPSSTFDTVVALLQSKEVPVETITQESDIVGRWVHIAGGGTTRVNACGPRGTVSVIIGKNRVQIFDAEDDGEDDSDEDDDDDDE